MCTLRSERNQVAAETLPKRLNIARRLRLPALCEPLNSHMSERFYVFNQSASTSLY